MSDSRIVVTYRAEVEASSAADLARRIAWEQTVELPFDAVADPHVLDTVVARVDQVRLDPESEAHQFLTLSHRAEMACGHLSQLLNLLFGNVSIYPGVRLTDLQLPDSLLASFPGPAFGLDGLRQRLGVYGRPLLASAIKPRGLADDALAGVARDFALGGGDLIKDDQNLVDDFEAFKRRVDACANAVDEARQATGRECLYLPHISAGLEQLPRFADYVEARGLAGVLICPMVVGLDTARALLADRGLLFMAHPALTGTYTNSRDGGIAHEILLGTLMRLAGADISVFPHFGGRFSFSRAQCEGIAAALRAPLGGLASAWPCPAGGMDQTRVADLCATYGAEAMFLVGGALLGHSSGMRAATRGFRHAIEAVFPPTIALPERSSKPRPGSALYRALDGFQWEGRDEQVYKDDHALRFKGVRRVELAGRLGERTAYDLRYFEVAPGGYSSHEKHLHAHVVIGARGVGRVRLGERTVDLARDDVLYIEPLEAHQLCNDGSEPFGFYCIVDHRRDRPMPP